MHHQAQKAAELAGQQFRLPFSRQTWAGTQGDWAGRGTGNSIDFQDHRAYQWGDDPRGIHWAAYARTEQLTMKQYRAELAPVVDVAVDVSGSMLFHPARATQTIALLKFCVYSATKSGAQVQLWAVNGNQAHPVEKDAVHNNSWLENLPKSTHESPPDWQLPWRPKGMKVIISDLLYPGEPGMYLDPICARGGSTIIYVPTLSEEAHCPGIGNFKLKDCESGKSMVRHISASVAKRYAHAYATHFEIWNEACLRRQAIMALIPCELELSKALSVEALVRGGVELN